MLDLFRKHRIRNGFAVTVKSLTLWHVASPNCMHTLPCIGTACPCVYLHTARFLQKRCLSPSMQDHSFGQAQLPPAFPDLGNPAAGHPYHQHHHKNEPFMNHLEADFAAAAADAATPDRSSSPGLASPSRTHGSTPTHQTSSTPTRHQQTAAPGLYDEQYIVHMYQQGQPIEQSDELPGPPPRATGSAGNPSSTALLAAVSPSPTVSQPRRSGAGSSRASPRSPALLTARYQRQHFPIASPRTMTNRMARQASRGTPGTAGPAGAQRPAPSTAAPLRVTFAEQPTMTVTRWRRRWAGARDVAGCGLWDMWMWGVGCGTWGVGRACQVPGEGGHAQRAVRSGRFQSARPGDARQGVPVPWHAIGGNPGVARGSDGLWTTHGKGETGGMRADVCVLETSPCS